MRRLTLLLLLCLASLCLLAQSRETIRLTGQVIDAKDQSVISHASVYVETSKNIIGTASDLSGRFELSIASEEILTDSIELHVSCIGYKTLSLMIEKQGHISLGKLPLLHHSTVMQTVVVKPKKERYSRKNNPAVAIIREAMRRKESNRLSSSDSYSYRVYQKTLLAQGDIRRGKSYWGIPSFKIKQFVDSSALARTPILPFSLREKHSIVSQQAGHRPSTLLLDTKHYGVEQMIDEGMLSSNLDQLLRPVDIYEDDLKILSRQIISPLHDLLGITFYKYYLLDTIPDLYGNACYRIQFVPIEIRDAGFSGTLLIDTTDYSVHQVEMRLPSVANVNWVDRLEIKVRYTPHSVFKADGTSHTLWLPEEQRLETIFRLMKSLKLSGIAHVSTHYSHYKTGREALRPEISDPGHTIPTDSLQRPMIRLDNGYASVVRPCALAPVEQRAYDLVHYMRHNAGYKFFSLVARIASVGFFPIPIEPLHRERVYFDMGPVGTIISANKIEGIRLRLGGMTTARIHDRLFAEGYATYGTGDKRWKYYLRTTLSMRPKEIHPYSFPQDNVSFTIQDDLFFPGESSLGMYKDPITSIFGNYDITRRYYGLRINLMHEKDWSHALHSTLWLEYLRRRPTGTLEYRQVNEFGEPIRIDEIAHTQVGASLTWTPERTPYSGRRDGERLAADLYKPTIVLSGSCYPRGLFGNKETYGTILFSYFQRVYMSVIGAMDLAAQSGFAFGDVPQTELFSPYGNRSWIQDNEAFQTLEPLEYIADSYLDFRVLYHMNGLLLNRVPLIKRLGLRELLGVHGYWGSVSKKNLNIRPGQELLPGFASPMQNELHLELSVGLENIFRVLLVQYYYRVTNPSVPAKDRHAFRMGVKVSF